MDVWAAAQLLVVVGTLAVIIWMHRRIVRQLEFERHVAAGEHERADRAFRAEAEQRQLAEALRDTASVLSSTLDLNEVFDRVLDQMSRVMPTHYGDIMLIDGAYARPVRERGFSERGLEISLFQEQFSIDQVENLRQMIITGDPCIIRDTRQYPHWIDTESSRWIRSMMSVPIRLDGEMIGFLNLTSEFVGTFNENHVAPLSAFASQVAIAIRNARLYEKSRHHADELESLVAARTRELERERERLQRLLDQEKALQTQRSNLVAHASHELRTPLTNLMTRLYLTRRQPERLTEHLDIMETVSLRMRRLIDDLLDISRLEHGLINLRRHDIILNALIEPAVELQRPEAERKQLTLSYDAPDDLLHINADAERLIQVITNLITNAINYTPDGGSVHVRLNADDHTVQISVTDTGIGIASENLSLIFEPFFRVISRVQGTGLGLSIARQIAELHGGTLTVKSELGQGSCFTLSLARSEQEDTEPMTVITDDLIMSE